MGSATILNRLSQMHVDSPKLKCEALTRRGRRCCNRPKGRHNGLSLCANHLSKSQKVFADAEQRWKEAGEPEGDL